ncbi:MAG: hypothetical protein IKU45_03140 [Clostridia bacterium]|nr:hypothetical protein [Clostridia bacterium]
MDVFYLVLEILAFVSYPALIGISAAEYIIQALALHRVAGKRKISNSWLAWIPIANCWILGSIVDDFEAETGSKRKFRVILFVLALVLVAICLLTSIAIISYFIAISLNNGIPTGDEELILGIILYATILPVTLVAVAYGALELICTYKIHEYIYPEKSVKYIVVSLLVPLGASICLLKNAKRCEEKFIYECEAPVAEEVQTVVEEDKPEE